MGAPPEAVRCKQVRPAVLVEVDPVQAQPVLVRAEKRVAVEQRFTSHVGELNLAVHRRSRKQRGDHTHLTTHLPRHGLSSRRRWYDRAGSS